MAAESPVPPAPIVPPEVDPSQPSPARVYDYLLGGVNNFAADRAAAELMKSMAPELVDAAFANRGFHQRAAKWIAERGVRQFIDIGSGLPTVGNTHEVVRKVRPDARVVYVDNDPMVRLYGSHLLGADDRAAVVLADLRDPESVLGSDAIRDLIDFSEPAAVLMTAVLHFVSYDDDPVALVGRYTGALAAGSYLAVSHITADQKPPKAVEMIKEAGRRSAGGSYPRSKAEVERIVGGLEVVPPYEGAPPEVTWVGLWNCEDPAEADSEGSRWLYCAVARKPA
jgi:S-adenosyl methyltransferase